MQNDPVGYGPDTNLYAYVKDDPTNKTDPSGNSPLEIGFAILDGVNLVNDVAHGASAGSIAADVGFLALDVQPIPGLSEVAHGAEALHAAAEVGHAASEAGEAARAARSESKVGSYTNTHESGATYSGKGTRERSQASGARVEKATGDKHVATDFSPSKSTRDAFKDESRRIDANGGAKSPDNHNKIESPGKKYREQDGGG